MFLKIIGSKFDDSTLGSTPCKTNLPVIFVKHFLSFWRVP